MKRFFDSKFRRSLGETSFRSGDSNCLRRNSKKASTCLDEEEEERSSLFLLPKRDLLTSPLGILSSSVVRTETISTWDICSRDISQRPILNNSFFPLSSFARITFRVTIHFANGHLSRLLKKKRIDRRRRRRTHWIFSSDLLREFIVDRVEHLAKSTPVGVEVHEDQFIRG